MTIKAYRTAAYRNTSVYRTDSIDVQFDEDMRCMIEPDETPMLCFIDKESGDFMCVPVQFVISIKEDDA